MTSTADFLTFRQWLERTQLAGAAAAFTEKYLGDYRLPNHCSLAELVIYAAEGAHSDGAKQAWQSYEAFEVRCRGSDWRTWHDKN